MTFWDFLDQNQDWAIVVFIVIYCLLCFLEGFFGKLLKDLKKKCEEKNPKWEKIK